MNNTIDKPAATTKSVAVATVIQVEAPTSAKPGDKALIGSDGIIEGWVGGGCVQPAVLKAAREVMQSGQPCLLRVAPNGEWAPIAGLTEFASSCLGRGTLLVFVEPLHVQPRLCILGDSDVARKLAEQAVQMSLNVSLQASAINREDTSARIDVSNDFDCSQADYIVIATQGRGDKKAITAALQSDCPCIRMVVSAKKLAALKTQLLDDGVEDAALARLEGPAGIHIGAHLPEEIALSVLAEIVKLRRTVNSESTHSEQALPEAAAAKPDEDNIDSGCCGS